MRIIGGQFGGRKFYPPAKKWPTRPTTDIAKEGLFNMLNNIIDFAEVSFLDLFGGTGNHSYEMISRGCQDITYVDKHGPCVGFVKKTATDLDVSEYIHIVKADVSKFLLSNTRQFDYIFAGPPYPLPWLDKIPDLIFDNQTLASDGIFVLEHNPNHDFKSHTRYWKERNYGETIFAFFK